MRRVVVVLLGALGWAPPGVDPVKWRTALAEDVVDLLATLAQAEPAIAGLPEDRVVIEEIAWPGMRRYEVPTRTVLPVLRAADADGFEQAAVIAADAPDVPGMILGKLLRPLETKPVAVAPASSPGAGPADSPGAGPAGSPGAGPAGSPGNAGGRGLLGVAARLPLPEWLVDHDLDSASAMGLRRTAPHPGDVQSTPEWHRLRGPADLAALDPALEGWEHTRHLLGG